VLNTKLKEFKIGDSSPHLTIKIQATPINRAMEMNNWLHEQIIRVKLLDSGVTAEYSRLMMKVPQALPKIKSLFDQWIEKVARNLGSPKENKAGKLYQMKCMYFRLTEEILKREEKGSKTGDISMLLQSEDFHKGVFAAAVEIILFIHNSTDLMLEEILELVNTSAFDFWRLLSLFPKFEALIPGPILMHFAEIENRIFEVLAWEKKSPIYSIISKVMAGSDEDQKELQLKFSQERFFKRLLEISAEHVEELTTGLGITNETIKERIWEATKLCLSSEIDLLVDRHLDHIILCGVYAVSKMEQSKDPSVTSYSFNQIITCYLQLSHKKGRNSVRLFQNVRLEEEKTGDIIEFYNAIYVPRMRGGLYKLCFDQEGISVLTKKAKIKVLAPTSPLKDMSDKAGKLVWQQKAGSSRTSSLKCHNQELRSPKRCITPMMTPRTQRLFAYAESPALRAGTPGFARGLHGQAMEADDQRRSYKNLLVTSLCKHFTAKGKFYKNQ